MADNKIIPSAADIAMHNLLIAGAKRLLIADGWAPKAREILQRQARGVAKRDRNGTVISTTLSRFLAEPSPRSASRPEEA